MKTYKEIQRIVKARYGYVPKTCWIADVKSNLGLITKKAWNRSASRTNPCPPEKWADLEEVIRQS